MEKDNSKAKLKEAVKLLEELYYKVHSGCAYENGKLRMIDDTSAKNDIANFVKSVKKSSRLKVHTSKYTCYA